jgi:hypothetical protein
MKWLIRLLKELKKDMEFDLIEPNVQVSGSATAARELGSIPTWLKTNGDAGTSGSLSTGSGTDLPGSGTDRDLTETILKTVIKEVYESGGEMDMLVCPPSVKQVISGFNANTTRFGPAEAKTEFAAIDVYSSDFGDLRVVPNRVMAVTDAKDVFIIQRDMMATAYLRDFQVQDLAKTGDSEKKQLLVEYTLEVRNEAAHGIILDINQ